MRDKLSHRPLRKRSEDGYMLLAVMFLLAMLTISLSVAVPKMTRSIQRDKELETMHRGKQYIRAVQLYYRKFHAFPPNMDALVKTNEIRFLRKKYIDPMTGKDDWKPLMYGQNKQPIVFGFFGQPAMTGSTLAGIGPAGGNGVPGFGGTSGTGGIPGLGGGGGSSSCASGTLGSVFGCSQDTGSTSAQSSGSGTTASGTDSSGNTTGASGTGGTGTGATDANGNPIPGGGTNGLSSSGSTAGQTFGGAGIIGVVPASPKVSLLIYKKKNHYNEWEFDYDPSMEMQTIASGGAGLNGTPASNMTNPIGTPGSSTNTFGGGQTSGTPFSSGGGTQTPPTSNQQQ